MSSLISSKNHPPHTRTIRVVYHPNLKRLVAMPPYEIHEIAITNFVKRVNVMLQNVSLYDDDDITLDVSTNLALGDEGDSEETAVVIPDFHLDLRSRNHAGGRRIPLWVGEVGFSSRMSLLKRQLSSVADMYPEADFAFIISIRETPHSSPSLSHPLHSQPKLHYSAFQPLVSPTTPTLTSVSVGDICWLKLKSIMFRCYLRGANGLFDFSVYTEGVSTFKLVYTKLSLIVTITVPFPRH